MKKFIATCVAVAMVAAVSTTALASDLTSQGGTTSKDVTATYRESIVGTMYSVDVTWGNMDFTYYSDEIGSWNPETHTYDGAVPAHWSCETDANKITVINHSNVAVEVGLSYREDASYAGVSGSFDNATLNIATAEGTAITDAPTASAALTLSGELESDTTDETVIGTVTVTMN